MMFELPRPVTGISLILAASLMAGANVTGSVAAESGACTALARELEQSKPDTQIQLNIALFSAVGKDCLALSKQLLAAGAVVEASNRFGTTALGQAARSGRLDMVDFLLTQGAAIDARNVAGSSPLYIAAENNQADVAQRLLEKGADPNLPGRGGVTPLAAAAYNGNEQIVTALLAHRADPNMLDRTEKAPILYAAAQGFTPVVQRLLDAGVDAKAHYGNDLTALMWAAGYADDANAGGAASVAKLLLDHGALLDAADNRGRTALMIAAEASHAEMVDLLIARGANRGLMDKAGKSASDLAANETVRLRLSPK
jgi:ankyrin repeat protein